MSAGWDPSSPAPESYPPYEQYVAMVVEQARARVDLVGIFLIVLGVLNLLGGAVFVFLGVQVALMPDAAWQKQAAETLAVMEKLFGAQVAPPSPAEMRTQALVSYFLGGFVLFVTSLAIGAGGYLMRRLQAYGLGLTASVLAMLPCISCTGCCGLGQVVGIWALVVLIDPQVRLAFSVVNMPPGSYPPQTPQPTPTPTPERPTDITGPGGQP